MTTVVMLGGNGYIGTRATQVWLKRDPGARFVVVSKSGKGRFADPRVTNVRADCTDLASVQAVLPGQVDYIVDFVGGVTSDPDEFRTMNVLPAQVMLTVAKEKHVKAMGYVGGSLGSKDFVQGKRRIADMLEASGVRTVVVNPTLVYGGGRKDSMAKLVPLLKFAGIFSKKVRPVTVDAVADELVGRMMD